MNAMQRSGFDYAPRRTIVTRVGIAKNFEYVIESTRAEGTSDWYTAAHDEFAIAMDQPATIELIKLEDPDALVDPESEGAHKLAGTPAGAKMGHIKLGHGHMALLPLAPLTGLSPKKRRQ